MAHCPYKVIGKQQVQHLQDNPLFQLLRNSARSRHVLGYIEMPLSLYYRQTKTKTTTVKVEIGVSLNYGVWHVLTAWTPPIWLTEGQILAPVLHNNRGEVTYHNTFFIALPHCAAVVAM
jgi:hypothetical protein